MGERGGWIVKQAQPFQRRPLRPRRPRAKRPALQSPASQSSGHPSPACPLTAHTGKPRPRVCVVERHAPSRPNMGEAPPAPFSVRSVPAAPTRASAACMAAHHAPVAPHGGTPPTRARMFRFEHLKKDKHKPWQRRPRAPARPLPLPPEAENARQTLQPRAPLIPPRSRNTYSDTARPAAYSATTRFRRLQSRSLP